MNIHYVNSVAGALEMLNGLDNKTVIIVQSDSALPQSHLYAKKEIAEKIQKAFPNWGFHETFIDDSKCSALILGPFDEVKKRLKEFKV